MAQYLPMEWREKRVAVVWNARDSSTIEATLVDHNEGGLFVEVAGEGAAAEEITRRVFAPWTAVRYVELLEEPDEDPGLQMSRAW